MHAGAVAVAAGLQARDVQPGQTVALMLPTGESFFASFFGVLLAGSVPVPLYPPARPSQLEDHMRRQAGILSNARSVALITTPEAQLLGRRLRAQVVGLRHVVTTQDLAATGGTHTRPTLQAQDIALVQYTSGSTGLPKGVILTHANLLANIRIAFQALRITSEDVFVSWLPLYHDMGLIGAWLGSLYHAMPLVLMSPLTFLAHLVRWCGPSTRIAGCCGMRLGGRSCGRVANPIWHPPRCPGDRHEAAQPLADTFFALRRYPQPQWQGAGALL